MEISKAWLLKIKKQQLINKNTALLTF